jgi:two-component system chemotaxis response regulator CheY
MDGEELLRELRKNGTLKTVPVLVISTDATRDRVQRMLALGAQGYITKPFSPEALREELDRVLGERQSAEN